MKSGKPVGKIVFFVILAAVVLCVAGLGLYFLMSNLHKNNIRKGIIAECPFTIAGDADWNIYPNNNQAGLIAVVSEQDAQANRLILVLDRTASQNNTPSDIGSIVLTNDYFRTSYEEWDDSWHDLEEKNVYATDHYIYIRAQYDSRAVLTSIKIGLGSADSIGSGSGVGVQFDLTDPFEITYYSYGTTNESFTQEYNEKISSWSAVTRYEYEDAAYDG